MALSPPACAFGKEADDLVAPPFQSSNTHSTTRALSTFAVHGLGHSCEARFTTTACVVSRQLVLRCSAMLAAPELVEVAAHVGGQARPSPGGG